jgi:aspartate aminotransferase
MMKPSPLATSVKPSATLAAGAKARKLRDSGVSVFDFSLGEPDQPTPAHICQAATDAMRAGYTHYTPVAGIPELRRAIAGWYERFHGLSVDPEQVVASNGAKHALHNALVATCGSGDEVVIPTPYWVSYSDLVCMAGATPVLVETDFETGFKLTPDQLRAALTPRTKLVMFNSPCNPTGTVYTRTELERLADVILETSAGVLSDEIYEQLCYAPAKPTCVATLRPAMAERTITVSGASKSYAMTGWRSGWAIAPPATAKAMADIQSQETGCPSSIGQYATMAGLEGPQDCVARMRQEYQARREIVCSRLRAIPGLRLHTPDGAFYAFFDVSAYFDQSLGGATIHDSLGFCDACLETAHVNLVPGSAFGCEGFVRMSYAASREQIVGGLDRLESWLTGRP